MFFWVRASIQLFATLEGEWDQLDQTGWLDAAKTYNDWFLEPSEETHQASLLLHTSILLFEASHWNWTPGEVLGLISAGYVPLASQSPNSVIIYSVANYRARLSHLWEKM